MGASPIFFFFNGRLKKKMGANKSHKMGAIRRKILRNRSSHPSSFRVLIGSQHLAVAQDFFLRKWASQKKKKMGAQWAPSPFFFFWENGRQKKKKNGRIMGALPIFFFFWENGLSKKKKNLGSAHFLKIKKNAPMTLISLKHIRGNKRKTIPFTYLVSRKTSESVTHLLCTTLIGSPLHWHD